MLDTLKGLAARVGSGSPGYTRRTPCSIPVSPSSSRRSRSLREGRRALRGLDAEAAGRDYPELVGQHEHAQLEALRAFPSDVARFVTRLAELEAAITGTSDADYQSLSQALAGLRLVRLRLESLAATVARLFAPSAR